MQGTVNVLHYIPSFINPPGGTNNSFWPNFTEEQVFQRSLKYLSIKISGRYRRKILNCGKVCCELAAESLQLKHSL